MAFVKTQHAYNIYYREVKTDQTLAIWWEREKPFAKNKVASLHNLQMD